MKQIILTNLLGVLSLLSFDLHAQTATCENQGFVVQAAGVATACAGSQTGQATVSSTGCSCMFSGCTYQWSDGQTFHTAFNLTAGIYNVTVTHPPDSLGDICVVTVEVTIEDGEEMIENILQTDLKCPDSNDASISLVPSLFAGQLNYQWSNGDTTATIEDLSAGTYVVTVSNFENCIEQLQFNIAAPENTLEITQANVSPACGGMANGKLELTVSGADDYTVLAVDGDDDEFNTLNALPAGDYEVIVTDENGCSTSTEITVPEGDLQVSLSSSSQSICAGNEVELQATTAQNATFNWSGDGLSSTNTASTIATPTQTTTYTVEVETTEGCSSVQEVTITVNPEPSMNFLYNGNLSICAGEFKNVVVSVPGATSYTWEPSIGVSGTNAVYLTPTQTTTYTVTAYLPNGCTASEDLTITVDNCGEPSTSLDDATVVIENIYPNPSNGFFQVTAPKAITYYAIYDISGKIIQQEKINTPQILLNLTEQAAGIYFLQVTSNGTTSRQKLVKQ